MRKFSAVSVLIILLGAMTIPAFGSNSGGDYYCHPTGNGFNVENGLGHAGHEDDFLYGGPEEFHPHGQWKKVAEKWCEDYEIPTTTTTFIEETTTTITESTTTSIVEDTTTTVQDTTTTTVVDSSTTTVVEDTSTTSSLPASTSTTSGPGDSVPEVTPTTVCTEDMECWDCESMGNGKCGVQRTLPYTGPPSLIGFSVSGLSLIGVGALLLQSFRRR